MNKTRNTGPMKAGSLIFIFLILAARAFAAADPAPESLPVERYALYVASNEGGTGRQELRYAVTDASRLATTMFEIGGVRPENSIILSDPTKNEIDQAFRMIGAAVERNKGKAKRTEFLFYYSGHSDETEFLLGSEAYPYAQLKAELTKVPTDVHVVMLDSCYSGNFIRSKGGSRDKPFLVDDSSVVQGHAYLSSSSETETSQESDTIQASYFTQALVTGLRGAADANMDGKVSLNELYYYAFNQTLSQTETAQAGPQHPSYNITLVGSGDLVLTDISQAEATLIFPKTAEGRFFLRAPGGQLVSEVSKILGTEMVLALSSGVYQVTMLNANRTFQDTIYLADGSRLVLDPASFPELPRSVSRGRGPGEEEGEEETPPAKEPDTVQRDLVPLSLSLVPGLMYPGQPKDNVNISLGVFMAQNHDVTGIQASSFGGFITGDLTGIQGSGFMNTLSGNMTGIQGSGFMNVLSGDGLSTGIQGAGFMNIVSGEFNGIQGSGFMNTVSGKAQWMQGAGFMNIAGGGFSGVQAAGFMNIAAGESGGVQAAGFLNVANRLTGVQIGVINIAHELNGVPIGVLNFIAGGIMSTSVWWDGDDNIWLQYQGGTKYLFTTALIGGSKDFSGDLLAVGYGVGTRLGDLTGFSIDLELIAKQYFDSAAMNELDQRIRVIKDDYAGVQDGTEAAAERDDAIMREVGDVLENWFVPSARATLNLNFSRHFGIFAGVNADIHVFGMNDEAFARPRSDSPKPFWYNQSEIYQSWFFGIRF